MEKEKGNKKELQINLDFDERKLEAMTYFMGEKSTSIAGAMQEYLNELYEKYVPSAMRRYLNRNDTSEQQDSKLGKRQAEAAGQGIAPGKKREERRQSQEQSQGDASPLKEVQTGEHAEENNQGMSMSM